MAGPVRRRGSRVGVGDLHPDRVRARYEAQFEVPARDPAVQHGVRGQLGDDEYEGVVRGRPPGHAPVHGLLRGQQPRQPRPAPDGGEPLGERTYGNRRSGGRGLHSAMLQRYGRLRSQALDREATIDLLEQMRRAL